MGIFTNRPAVKFCTPFMLGLAIGWHWSFSGRIVLPALFAACSALLLGSLAARLPSARVLLVFLLIVLFGIVKITYDSRIVPGDAVADEITPGRSCLVRGVLTDIPDPGQAYVRFVVEAESILSVGAGRRVSGGILVSARREAFDSSLIDELTYGRTLFLTGELTAPPRARNPGEFDPRAYLQLNNIDVRMFLDPDQKIGVGPPAQSNLLAILVAPVRRSVELRLDRLIGGNESIFLKGLITGDRAGIPMEVKTAFINSGVMHILAVSGLHVAIIVMILLALLQAARVPEKSRILVTCLLLVYYNFLTGGAASVTRSVLMAIVFLCGKVAQRRIDFYNTLALSAIPILLIDSKQFFNPGFQLSFAAVFSLVYLYPKLEAAVRLLPSVFRRSSFPAFCLSAVCVSLAAGIGTLPFTSFYFGKISLVGFAANMIVVPLSNIILALGMLAVAVSCVWGWLGSVYAGATGILTQALLGVVHYFGGLPFAYLTSHFTLWSSLAFYGAVGLIIAIVRPGSRKRGLIALLIAADLTLFGNLIRPAGAAKLRVTFLDIGQGDATFIELPDGRDLLVDAGPKSASGDAGERFIEPFLTRQGIGLLDKIVLSHPHSDHLGGIPYLLRHIRVSEVVDAGSRANSALAGEYLHLVDSLAISRTIVKAGCVIPGLNDVRLYVLHPSGAFAGADSGKHENLNNQSVVLKLVYGESSLLLAGDAEKEAEERMTKAYGGWLRCDVLKTGHHGSITSSSEPFLDRVRPSMALISVGARNKYRLPSEPVLRRLAEKGIEYFRTDETGALAIESDGKTWSVVDWR
jgi:competence protein ComEC